MPPLPSHSAETLGPLLAAVRARPEEDAPRLALADWLTGQNDPRGEFIRIQLDHAAADEWTARRDDLERASRRWLKEYQAAWLGPPAEGVTVNWDRGLPAVAVTGEVVLAGWPDGLARNLDLGWIASLELALNYWRWEQLRTEWLAQGETAGRLRQLTRVRAMSGLYGPAFAILAPLRGLRGLDLENAAADDAAVEPLLGLSALEQLSLPMPQTWATGAPFGVAGAGLSRLAGAGALGALRHFRAGSCRLTDDDLETLARHAAGLETLWLGFYRPASRLEADGVTPAPPGQKPAKPYRGSLLKRRLDFLAALPRLRSLTFAHAELPRKKWSAPPLPHLRHLDLWGCKLSDAVLESLTALPGLESLSLATTKITGAGLAPLAHLPRLRRLNLYNCSLLQPDTLAALADYPVLEALDLSYHHSTPGTLDTLARLTNLRALNLSGSRFTGTDWQAPAVIDTLASLRGLETFHVPARAGTDAVRVAAGFTSLRRLVLYQANLDASAVRALATMPNLRHLDLSGSTVSPDAWEALGALDRLESLGLYSTPLGDANARHLRGLTALADLDASLCGLTDAGLPALAALPALETLNLDDNGLSPAAVQRSFPRVRVQYRYEV